ncbi:cytochrome P450 [Trametes meyenii]|nr:cytochrome P450 [Trametes meyenii]
MLCAAAGALAVLWPHVRRRVKQLRLRKLPGPPSPSFVSGVSKKMHTPLSVPYREQVLTSYGGAIRLPDFLGEVHLAISDPLALATMFGQYRDSFDLPDWPGISSYFSAGRDHAEQRKRLSPVFSVRYIRDMVPIFNSVAQELIEVLRKQASQPETEVEIAEYLSRFSLECVGRAALGYSFGPLEKHGTDYSRALKEFGYPNNRTAPPMAPFLPWLKRVFPSSWLRFGAEVIPYAPLQRMRGISDSVHATARQILQQKKEALQGDGNLKTTLQELGDGSDLISILSEFRTTYIRRNGRAHSSAVRHNATPSDDISSFSEENLLGQMSLLLLQATDTTSTTLVRLVQQLALHPEVQGLVRQEVVEATAGQGRTLQDLDFDAYAQLSYMDAVIRETIRMYPGFYVTSRVAAEDTVIPLSTPIRGVDGTPIKELDVPAGTTVWLNIFGANRDPTIWGPDATVWKPERWLSPLPDSVTNAHMPSVFANTMTFVAGPRSCIGYNFALAEIRVILAHLLMAFEIAPSGKEIIWKMSGIASPSVKGSKTTKPEMPVLMSPLQ